jgi:hypothetical protein
MPKGKKKAGKKRALKKPKEKDRAKKGAARHAAAAAPAQRDRGGSEAAGRPAAARTLPPPRAPPAAAPAPARGASGERQVPPLAPLAAPTSGHQPALQSAHRKQLAPAAQTPARARGQPVEQAREQGALASGALKSAAAASPGGASAVQDRRASGAPAATAVGSHAPARVLAASRPGSARSVASSHASSAPGSPLPVSRPGSGAPTRGMDTIEHALVRAAELLMSADFVLIAAGAGFSADSGLPVYKDIANVDAYKRMQVTYSDLCTPDWLQRDPDIFFGFWGSCFNDYLDTHPHKGYDICKAWSDSNFLASAPAQQAAAQGGERRQHLGAAGNEAANSLAPALQRLTLSQPLLAQRPPRAAPSPHSSSGGVRPPSRQASHVGRRGPWAGGSYVAPAKESEVFVYTSNVDTAFERAGFPRDRMLEIHGNVCEWQVPACHCLRARMRARM